MIIERTDEFYIKLHDSDHGSIVYTDQKELSEITRLDVEEALRDMSNQSASSNDHILREPKAIDAMSTSLQEQIIEDMYTYTEKQTRSTLGEVYDRNTPYHPNCLQQYSKAYSEV